MSFSRQTTNFELPQYDATDKPSWLEDFNYAMNKIDANLGKGGGGGLEFKTVPDGWNYNLGDLEEGLYAFVSSNVKSYTMPVNIIPDIHVIFYSSISEDDMMGEERKEVFGDSYLYPYFNCIIKIENVVDKSNGNESITLKSASVLMSTSDSKLNFPSLKNVLCTPTNVNVYEQMNLDTYNKYNRISQNEFSLTLNPTYGLGTTTGQNNVFDLSTSGAFRSGYTEQIARGYYNPYLAKLNNSNVTDEYIYANNLVCAPLFVNKSINLLRGHCQFVDAVLNNYLNSFAYNQSYNITLCENVFFDGNMLKVISHGSEASVNNSTTITAIGYSDTENTICIFNFSFQVVNVNTTNPSTGNTESTPILTIRSWSRTPVIQNT